MAENTVGTFLQATPTRGSTSMKVYDFLVLNEGIILRLEATI